MLAKSTELTHEEADHTATEDWTPELQIAHMLDLCEAQMESALAESDIAVDALIKVFTELVDTTHSIGKLTESLEGELEHTTASGLNQQVAVVSKQMASAVVAFQFYDKLTQRLEHVRYSLSTLALFVCDRSQTKQPDQWYHLLSTLRQLYRTEEERKIFQLMVEGMSAEEARAHLHQTASRVLTPQTGEIELF